MKINNLIAGGLIGLSAICTAPKADNLPDKQAVRYTAIIHDYLQKAGYTATICGINPEGKDFMIGIDDTLRGNDTLEPKITLYP